MEKNREYKKGGEVVNMTSKGTKVKLIDIGKSTAELRTVELVSNEG